MYSAGRRSCFTFTEWFASLHSPKAFTLLKKISPLPPALPCHTHSILQRTDSPTHTSSIQLHITQHLIYITADVDCPDPKVTG